MTLIVGLSLTMTQITKDVALITNIAPKYSQNIKTPTPNNRETVYSENSFLKEPEADSSGSC